MQLGHLSLRRMTALERLLEELHRAGDIAQASAQVFEVVIEDESRQ
jgi:hypothetical protein